LYKHADNNQLQEASKREAEREERGEREEREDDDTDEHVNVSD
jgi:hypothetical protein